MRSGTARVRAHRAARTPASAWAGEMDADAMVTADRLRVEPPHRYLYQYLLHTGFIVPPGDISALAAGIRRMLDLGSSEYAALSAAAKDRIDSTYSLAHVADLYKTFLCGGRKPVGI